jgi:hypothetical protein
MIQEMVFSSAARNLLCSFKEEADSSAFGLGMTEL